MIFKTIDWNDEKVLRRALSLMPTPMIRQRDAADAVDKMRLRRSECQALWNALVERGWIVRTGHLIGNAKRRFYWERVSGFGNLRVERNI